MYALIWLKFSNLILLASLVILFINNSYSDFAFACSCIPSPPPIEALEESTAVFSGTVLRVDRGLLGIGDLPGSISVTFDVERSWKGVTEKTVVVETSSDSAMCGYGFKESEKYLVYTHEVSGSLHTGICSRTVLLANAQEDLDALGSGTVLQPVDRQNTLGLLSIIALLAGGLVVGGIILLKKLEFAKKQD